ncbi:transcription elongation factor GreA [Candidatus Peregrinibacteria bacterium]|nr:transcription elongation factor GreA [Candidatus Peregrinibacteria bacterium]
MPKKTTKKAEKKASSNISNDELYDESGKKVTLITKEGLDKLKEELDYLKNVKRKEVAARIKEAISYGDLSENAEYEEAKNEQAFVEGRILELEEKVKNVKIISEKPKVTKTVQLGTTVHLKNLTKNRDELEVYTIVGSTEADPFAGKISNESPVGSSLLDRQKGDTIKVSAPSGSIEYKIKKLY